MMPFAFHNRDDELSAWPIRARMPAHVLRRNRVRVCRTRYRPAVNPATGLFPSPLFLRKPAAVSCGYVSAGGRGETAAGVVCWLVRAVFGQRALIRETLVRHDPRSACLAP